MVSRRDSSYREYIFHSYVNMNAVEKPAPADEPEILPSTGYCEGISPLGYCQKVNQSPT